MKKITNIFFVIIIALTFSVTNKSNSQTGYNAVLEYCTGTWCQWCPCGHNNIHDILQNYPNTMVLAYHGGGSDPWQTYSAGIRSQFGFNSYPSGAIGRKTGVISYSAWNNEVVLQSLLIQPGVSIEVSSKNYDAASRMLTATIKITPLTDLNGEYYMNNILTENNILYPQSGNGTCTGYTNYNHTHIVKSMLNGDLGELIHSGAWTTGQIVTRNISYSIPVSPQVVVPENCELNMFVYKQGTSISTNSNIQQSLRTPLVGTIGIQNISSVIRDFTLSQNYPNPFNPTTTFSFSIPKDGNTSLKIYDVLGNQVDVYMDGFAKAGTYSVEFDGSKLSSGIYFYSLTTSDFSQTKKMILSK